MKLCRIEVIIAIHRRNPVADMIKANAYVKERNARLGLSWDYYPGEAKVVLCQVLFSKKEL
jgi:succinyl-CoA synthetase alpha subunit